MKINVVSAGNQDIWQREISPGYESEFVFSTEPIEADWHVIYNHVEPMVVPNQSSRIIFVAVEPPESTYYDPRVLRQYGAVISPGYRYLQNSLPNHLVRTGLLTWRIDVSHQNEISGDLIPRSALQTLVPPAGNKISVITSTKTLTPLHRQRLRLIDYLEKRIPELEVFGGGRIEVDRKLDIFGKYRHHIALENAIHHSFWSEKLADPLLGLNQVFFGGHPSAKNDFPGKSVVVINPWKKRQTYRKIMDYLNQMDYRALVPEIRAHQSKIIGELNISSVLTSLIQELDKSVARVLSTESTTFPAHRSLGLRTRIARRR